MILGIDASQANRRTRSGTEWCAFHLINEFKKLLGNHADLEVRLYLRDLLQDDLARDMPANFSPLVLTWPFKYLWAQIRLSAEIFLRPPDILFSPAHTIPIFHPSKTFTTLHDVGFEDFPELYDILSLWYHKFSASLAVKNAYHIFTVSNFSKNEIVKKFSCDPRKITITYLGIDRVFSAEKSQSILENYGLKEKNYLLFVGRLDPKKNILGLIKAYEIASSPHAVQFPDLVLAGQKYDIPGVDFYLQSRPNLRSKIIFLGYIPEKHKSALYRGAKAFIFPTLYEGFGIPILEAQGQGVPVLTSKTASNPEVAGEGALLVDPRNIQEIARGINELLQNEPLKKEVIKKGYQNLKRFSWEKTAKLTLHTMGIVD